MQRLFQTFVDGLAESRDTESLRQSMAEIAAALDLSCFAYLSVPRDPSAEPRLISTYPSRWTTHYLRHHYERFDPVVVQALRDPHPFEWGLGIGPATYSEKERELFEEASRFGIRHGFTIPVHDSTGAVAAVTFAADDQGPHFKRSRINSPSAVSRHDSCDVPFQVQIVTSTHSSITRCEQAKCRLTGVADTIRSADRHSAT